MHIWEVLSARVLCAESVTPCLGLVDKRNFEPELDAKSAELDAKNAELDAKTAELGAKNAHLETEMSRVWEELQR